MDDLQRAIRGIVSLVEQGSLSLAVWNVYLEKIHDEPLRSLALRLRSSLEYGVTTKQLRGIVKANYKGAVVSWQQTEETDIKKAGIELITAVERYLKSHSISVV